MAQTVKRLPTMWETRVQSLAQEDLLEKGMATHSSILASPSPPKKGAQRNILEKEMATHSSTLAWKIPLMEEPRVHGVTKSQTRLSDFSFSFCTDGVK